MILKKTESPIKCNCRWSEHWCKITPVDTTCENFVSSYYSPENSPMICKYCIYKKDLIKP